MSLEDMADGMMLYNFQARYKHQFKEVLDHKKYGFDSLVDCLKSVPHLIEMIGIGKTFKLMPNKNPIQTEVCFIDLSFGTNEDIAIFLAYKRKVEFSAGISGRQRIYSNDTNSIVAKEIARKFENNQNYAVIDENGAH